MLTQRIANIVFCLAVIAACVYFAVVAQGFEASGLLASSGLPSKFFPQLLLAFCGICAAVVAFLYAFKGQAGGDERQTVFTDFAEAGRGLLVMLVAVACYYIWKRFGFVPMALVMGPLCLIAMGVRNVLHYVTVVSLTGLVYLIFTYLLKVQLT